MARRHVGGEDDEEDEGVADERGSGAREDGGQHGDPLVVAQNSQQADGEDEDEAGQDVAVDGVPQHGQEEVHVNLQSQFDDDNDDDDLMLNVLRCHETY